MITFKTLIEIQLLHDFYSSAYTDDLEIVPTETTERILRGHRMQLKTSPAGYKLISEFRDEAPVIEANSDMRLTFKLQSKNADFSNFTDIPAPASANHVRFYTNNNPGPADELLHDQRYLYGTYIPVQFMLDQDEARLELINENGTVLKDITLAPSKEEPIGTWHYEYKFDTEGFAKGKYELKIYTGPALDVLESSSKLYLDSDLKPGNLFGIIEVNESLASITAAYTTPLLYKLKYLKKEIDLHFEVNFSTSPGSYYYFIEDEDVDQPGTPYAVINRLKGEVDPVNSQLIRFNKDASNNPVSFPMYQLPRLGLVLARYDNVAGTLGREVELDNLPNPSTRSPSPKVIINK